MTKTFVLPLLAALPALLVSCRDDVDISRYQRMQFNSYQECAAYYRAQIQQGLQNPCARSSSVSGSGASFMYYGPYYYNQSGTQRYVGYDASGNPAPTGLSYDSKRGSYGSFKAGGTRRGGLTSSARSGGFGG
ncbi:hypothetical protein [Deinococcus wulumuqiensis]|uniref:DUF1190 domain-containing protein n=1 Tax=Deinococcus wulumuqiensis TaxID=980427 RepID=A0AAV4K1T5_9DEIO|nr:hypothetical protein [Deinococcus wulumuqiensis]QII19715.1 hypothetical protein G6R31_02320 [Deinococcus wulumuqiensis R12]GGI71121.1 hypothetical protein GCM10010914_01470 [Deinococcus wulumuqiensis]GGP28462.1 hypothetical protein GCM10008021_01130 [Deinococcus wulumuqiensis]